MLKVNYNKNWYEIEFNGIKVIETKYTSKFIKQILNSPEEIPYLIIDNKNIRWKNVIYINEFTKYDNFINLSKTNFLYKKIIEKIADQSLVNEELIKNIINEINEELNIDDVLMIQYDLPKIIASCFELIDLGYIEDGALFDILNKIEYDEKKLIIFDNLSYITYEKCKKLLNNFNILIICSDIRGIINNCSLMELVCFINESSIFDVINIEKLISFLEIKTSLSITEKDINNFLDNKNDQKSSVINFYLKSI
ncbi:MAG: hypothetical protein HDR43_01120 [Mycoplasma sp.]|nr:hypothetical protein [Mycoplasma sp.]